MLRLRNTLTRHVDEVDPLEPGRVRMYTCGPTVYRYAHVGNLRSNLLADLIRRTLLYHGFDVLHVKNITDVGHLRDEGIDRGADPMLVQAGLESKTPAEIAAAYEAAFHADEALVNILPAHVFPRATEHIEDMLRLAEALEDAGYAYATPEGNVYYDVAAFDGYGRLSGNTLADLRAGHRSDIEPDKRDPADFALWKAAGPGRLLKWPTARWGEGFPGWHLECSAMAMRYLGPRFDIHTGGIDNVFPHHEDEIAQSAPIVGDVPATSLGPRRVPADGREEDGQVGRQLPARHRAGRSGHRSAGVPVPAADVTLFAQARVLGSIASCGRGRARVASLGSAHARGAAGRPGRGRRRPCSRRDPPAIDPRASHRVSPGTAATPPATWSRTAPRPRPLPSRRTAARSMIASSRRSTTTWTCRSRWRCCARSCARRSSRTSAAGSSSTPMRSLASTSIAPGRPRSGDVAVPDEVRSLVADRDAARAAADYPAADNLRARIDALGWEVIDTPAGSEVRPRA